MNADDASSPEPRPQPEGMLADMLLKVPRDFRRALVVVVHLLLAVLANYLAFSLRFDGLIPSHIFRLFVRTLPWLLAARATVFLLFRLDEGMWRYAGLWDLRRIGMATVTSTLVFYVCIRWGYGTDDYPRSVFLIDTAVLLILMGAFRITPRIYREFGRERGRKRLLIVGAGDAGERILRQLQHDPHSTYDPIGFADDDPKKLGQRIHGIPVMGTIADLPQLVRTHALHEVMVAIHSADSALIRGIVTSLESFDVPITTVVISSGPGGRAGVSGIRSLSVGDLLARPPVDLGVERVERLIAGRRVLVTGAGGSIGSELCRQIAALGPASLVMYERYENGLYAVANTLVDRSTDAPASSVIGDVTDEGRLNAVFRQYTPEIVFHAAAHKHVPLMELNPCEAIKNNVVGTRLVAEAAVRHGVERFILISTDKAVNPTSIMGASKRVAELVIRQMALRAQTRFVAVRFGNVLGSNGSVLLRFQEQVKAGGPVTVTDPNIKRFFMLIPEAVELVLHAASVGRGGDTLILDMGEQVRVLDLARNVIRLAGHVPDKDIPIVFTGLRPGEKLYEELVGDRESLEPSPVDKILRIASEGGLAPAGAIPDLERHAVDGSTADVIHLLSTIVPTFRSNTADAGAATPSAADHTASRPAAADDDGTLAPSLASDQLSLP